MSYTQKIIVKVYYNDRNEKHPEIRRFCLTISSDSDMYEALETKVSQLNTDYTQGQFILQYIDEDSDRITFSSNAEFQSALKNYSMNGMIKIFAQPKSKTHEQASENTTIHIGVICDGCQGPVIGNRYKCLECFNYDLCQTCSNKNLHSEHNMLKLTRVFQHDRGRRARHYRHHFMPEQCRPSNFGAPRVMSDFLNLFKGKELSELIETHVSECLHTETFKDFVNQLKTDKSVNEMISLDNVGKTVREVLTSFGIKCDCSVDKQKEESKSNKKNEEVPITTANENDPTLTTSTASPSLNDLMEQLQAMFVPMFQHSKPTATEDQTQIEKCVELMTSMGFVDSNGVLTELVKSKKGDLEQVLDALNPRNYKN
ncbi:unnamed protein product [Rotaria magnacalcarata]|uniref:Sequestosome-1 n=1 Tax=Rotaria magnacalcarata TaxID=392030 RepID=A0A815EN41_9BILA|nr:unnamed protein product [Rotaria magnacalcarata]CAF1314294.1 unnamed protein product [Rotaria magnacalcarata]CAF3968567.1 unnamed protein product [Rotaria magnacalcarata]CAF3996314.1 unnamed protein product [Rotaria magnacalcarata]